MDNNKRGCLAEYRFAVECLKRGYEISMPLLDASIYDCIVDVNGDLKKVQIKSTTKKPERSECRRSVHVRLANNKQAYDLGSVDYFAVYVYEFDGFFIFKNTGAMQSVRLSPQGKYSDYFNNFAFD